MVFWILCKLSMALGLIWRGHIVLVAIFAAFSESTVKKRREIKRFLEFASILGAFSQMFCVFYKTSIGESENLLEL